jgi:putative restriction endonuclease
MDVTNGLLLCATHHALFDARLLNVLPGGVIEARLPVVAERTAADHDAVTSLHGRQVTLPADSRLHPSQEALEHRGQGQR